MFLIKLAFKNLTRHKRRTTITSVSLAIGLVMFILMDSLLSGAFNTSDRNLKEAETGDGKVLSDSTFTDYKFYPLSHRVENPEDVMNAAGELGVKSTSRVIINGDMIYSDDYFPRSGYTPVLFTAVDPDRDNDAFAVFKERNLVAGRFLQPGHDEVVIGSWLAEDTGAEVGDFFTLSVRTASDGDNPGFLQTIDVEIAGIIRVDNPIINRRVVYFPLDMADYHLDLMGSVTEVTFKLPRGKDPLVFKEEMAEVLPDGFEFYTWQEISADYMALTNAEKSGSAVFILLTILIAIVGITNTMLMTINERQRELGMMRALGMSEIHIRKAFLLEAAGIGFIGSVTGMILGYLANIPLVEYGLDYSKWMREADLGYRISSVFRGAWNPHIFIAAFVLGILIPVLVAIIPTKRAIKKSIPDAVAGR